MSFADRTAELWLEIDQLHLKHLQHDDNPVKIDIRKKLESRVKEYLCLVPQERKFVYSSTGDIISNSVRWISDFSLTKAAQAFQHVEQYAANLLNQPWRQEFRSIRQYNGFYVHNIKSVLSGVEKLFFSMGYVRDEEDPEIFKLPDRRFNDNSVNMDAVTQVARDCLLARMESLILQEIYIGVIPQFPLSLEELMEFRRDHIGAPEDAIRELLYRRSQSRYQLPPCNLPFNGAPQVYAPFMSPLTNYPGFQAGTPGFQPVNNMFSPLTNSFPTIPGTFSSTPFTQQTTGFAGNSYQTGYMGAFSSPSSVNGGQSNGMLNSYPLPGTQLSGQLGGTGYILPGMSAQIVPVSSVPGGLGGTRLMEHSPAGSSTSTLRQGQIPTTILDLTGDEVRRNDNGARQREKSERGKPREVDARPEWGVPPRHEGRRDRGRGGNRGRASGGEEIESWDFVYKELEQQGYSKDQAERPDILSGNRNSGVLNGDETSDEEVRRNLNRMHISENTRDRWGTVGLEKSRNLKNSQEYPPINKEMTSESEQDISRYSSANSKNTNREYRTPTQERPQRASRGHGQQSQSTQKPRKPDTSEKWECGTCTYHNPASNNICEMCSKTKERSYKATLMSQLPDVKQKEEEVKGDECLRCTLVNRPGAKVCDACGSTLGLSPPV